MMKFKIKLFLLCLLCVWHVQSKASILSENVFKYPFYLGGSIGYGSTTWQGLVAAHKKQNQAMLLSTPKKVSEGGWAGGVFAGYEFTPYFALEGSYTRYPNAKIIFDEMSLVAFDYNTQTVNTRTELFALMGKIMLIVPCTAIRFYSSFGFADTHRVDSLKESWRINPSFGVGFNYNLTQRIMAELGASYTSGYGESELNPAIDFMPFVYGVFFRLAFRF